MLEVRDNFSGGLDLDSALYNVAKNAYVDALNITRDTNLANNDVSITNIVGNRLVNYTLPSGINKVIGAYGNETRNNLYYFVFNNSGNHSILEYDNTTRTTIKIFESKTDSGGVDILNFTENEKINSINVYTRQSSEGDLLFFIDSLGRPTCLNILRFKAGQYTPVTRDIIDVAKRPPLATPYGVYASDTSKRANSLRNRLFRFKYRWLYDDFEKSTFSPISSIIIPDNILDETFTNVITNNNIINISVNTGPKNVSKVELAVSIQNKTNEWSDFLSVDVIDVSALQDDLDINFAFYNDGVYSTVDINESILDFDYVPDLAKAQELANGNVLTYWNITEGYDRTLSPNVEVNVLTVPAGGGNPTGSLNGVVVVTLDNSLTQVFQITFSGVPATGTIIEVRVKQISNGNIFLAATYTTVASDTSATVAIAIRNSFNSIGQVDTASSSGNIVNVITDNPPTGKTKVFESLSITPPTLSTQSNSVPTFSFSKGGKIGLKYRDRKGKTNGVLYYTDYVTPAYSEDGTQAVLLPYINTKIYHTPPEWAWSYEWVLTQDKSFFIYWYTIDVNTSESNYIYFDVSNFPLNAKKSPTTSQVLSYTFQDGDRMRLIKRDSDNFVFDDSYDAAIEGLVVDPVILGVAKTGTFLKIKKVAPLSTVTYTSKNFIIQIYRPDQQSAGGDAEQQVYYEFGHQYYIVDPELPTRSHAGGVTDQDIPNNIPAESNFYNGDAYFRFRSVVTSDTGSASYNTLDRNFVDTYLSAVNDIEGRPSIIDINAKRATYEAMVRFGQAYQPNTNVNGFNRFYPNNFDEYDLSYGGIVRAKVRDRFIRVFQELKVGSVPIFNQISKNADGTQLLVVTDKLLNPIQYYSGDFGIGQAAESLASFNFADYFCDTVNGVICRVSNNGVQPISVLYKANSFAKREVPLRVGDYKIYGVYEPSKTGNYIMAFEETPDSEAKTFAFTEDTNSFETPLSFQPEMMASLGTLLITFKNGNLYTHDSGTYNNFYGVQYDSYIDVVFNVNYLQKKQPVSLMQKASIVWTCPNIETDINSYGTTKQESELIEQDFSLMEGEYHAAILRDKNSLNGLLNGDFLKGQYCKIRFLATNTSGLISLNAVSLRWNDSPNNR